MVAFTSISTTVSVSSLSRKRFQVRIFEHSYIKVSEDVVTSNQAAEIKITIEKIAYLAKDLGA